MRTHKPQDMIQWHSELEEPLKISKIQAQEITHAQITAVYFLLPCHYYYDYYYYYYQPHFFFQYEQSLCPLSGLDKHGVRTQSLAGVAKRLALAPSCPGGLASYGGPKNCNRLWETVGAYCSIVTSYTRPVGIYDGNDSDFYTTAAAKNATSCPHQLLLLPQSYKNKKRSLLLLLAEGALQGKQQTQEAQF